MRRKGMWKRKNCYWLLGHLGQGQFCCLFVRVMALHKGGEREGGERRRQKKEGEGGGREKREGRVIKVRRM